MTTEQLREGIAAVASAGLSRADCAEALERFSEALRRPIVVKITKAEPITAAEWERMRVESFRALFSNTAKRSDDIRVGDRVKCSRALMRTGAGFHGFGVVDAISPSGRVYYVRLGDGSLEKLVRANLCLERKEEIE